MNTEEDEHACGWIGEAGRSRFCLRPARNVHPLRLGDWLCDMHNKRIKAEMNREAAERRVGSK